ncbi:MAG: hypothetical protein J6N72_06985, partial [Psychrobacter sp.]|nr:hypothetical protein [Psychrobacter sp.]
MKADLSVRNIAGIVAMSIALTACGGGSDSDSGTKETNTPVEPPVVTPPVKPPVVTPPVEPPVVKPPVVTPPVEPPVVKPPVVEPPVVKPPVVIPIPGDVKTQVSKIPNGDIASASLLASNIISIQRQACGLGGLSHDEDLAKISRNHAQYLAYLYSNGNITTNLHRQ